MYAVCVLAEVITVMINQASVAMAVVQSGLERTAELAEPHLPLPLFLLTSPMKIEESNPAVVVSLDRSPGKYPKFLRHVLLQNVQQQGPLAVPTVTYIEVAVSHPQTQAF